MASRNTTNKTRTAWVHPEENVLKMTVRPKQAITADLINDLWSLYWLLYSQKTQIENIRSNPHQWTNPAYYLRKVPNETYPADQENGTAHGDFQYILTSMRDNYGFTRPGVDKMIEEGPISIDRFNEVIAALKYFLSWVKNYRSWWKGNGYCARSCQTACQATCQLYCQGCNNWQCHDQKCGTF